MKRYPRDLSGYKFGQLVVLEKNHVHVTPSGQKVPYWLCKCECGNTTVVNGTALKNGYTISCGCYRKKKLSEVKVNDLSGKRFGMLLVLNRAEGRSKHRNAIWSCKCDCGKIINVPSDYLTSYHTMSCGCKGKSNGEIIISMILDQLQLPYKTSFAFDDLKGKRNMPLRFDFALFDYNQNLLGLIEYQGEQHYKKKTDNFGDVQRLRTDPMKRQYCKEHNILLEEIKYTDDIYSSLEKVINNIYSHANFVPSSVLTEKV